MVTRILTIVFLAGIMACSSPQSDKESKKEDTQAKPEQQQKEKEFAEIVKMECKEKKHVREDGEEFIQYRFLITNLSGKDIDAFRGRIIFTNKQGHTVKSFVMKYDKGLEADAETYWEARTRFDQFMDEENALRMANVEDLKCAWEPIEVEYSDGTLLDDLE